MKRLKNNDNNTKDLRWLIEASIECLAVPNGRNSKQSFKSSMFLRQISIRRPVLSTMLSLALILFGLIGMTRLPVRELRDIAPPIVRVTTVYPDANAKVVETEVTERFEEAVI